MGSARGKRGHRGHWRGENLPQQEAPAFFFLSSPYSFSEQPCFPQSSFLSDDTVLSRCRGSEEAVRARDVNPRCLPSAPFAVLLRVSPLSPSWLELTGICLPQLLRGLCGRHHPAEAAILRQIAKALVAVNLCRFPASGRTLWTGEDLSLVWCLPLGQGCFLVLFYFLFVLFVCFNNEVLVFC